MSTYRTIEVNYRNAFTTTNTGKRFSADVYYADGTPATPVTGEVLYTNQDTLYQTGRSGPAF